MCDQKIEKLIQMQERIGEDPQYARLCQEYRERDAAVTAVLEQLPRLQREVIEDYLGLCAQLHTRMVLLCCQVENE